MPRRSKTMDLELRSDTRQVPSFQRILAMQGVPTLTLLHHPRLERVGERVYLFDLLEPGHSVEVSRLTPEFASPRGNDGYPLATQYISRKPVVFESRVDGLFIDVRQSGEGVVKVDGVRVAGDGVAISNERVDSGVVVELGSQIVVVLHRMRVDPDAVPGGATAAHGLIGESEAIHTVREAIERAARQAGPVLVRGETGTGKELVASAIHALGPRRSAPYVAVNMAAIPPTLAASELFGHARGAFSGAHQANAGMFGRADGGTLFMDEIGDTPLDVQAALLRVMETGEVQQVGADRMRKVDVRLVAATDADLEAMTAEGRFRAPLRFRLSNHEITLPPLRARRDDVGRLLVHFIRLELEALGRAAEIDDETDAGTTWIPAALTARLARYGWPGNVRQLRNVARWLAGLDHRARPVDPNDAALVGLLPAERALEAAAAVPNLAGAAMSRGAAGGRRASGGDLDDDEGPSTISMARPRIAKQEPKRRSGAGADAAEIERLMVENDFKLAAVADVLGLSRPAFNDIVDAHPTLRRAQSLSVDEIRAARELCGTIDAMWRHLRVSEKSLKLRMSALGLPLD